MLAVVSAVPVSQLCSDIVICIFFCILSLQPLAAILVKQCSCFWCVDCNTSLSSPRDVSGSFFVSTSWRTSDVGIVLFLTLWSKSDFGGVCCVPGTVVFRCNCFWDVDCNIYLPLWETFLVGFPIFSHIKELVRLGLYFFSHLEAILMLVVSCCVSSFSVGCF